MDTTALTHGLQLCSGSHPSLTGAFGHFPQLLLSSQPAAEVRVICPYVYDLAPLALGGLITSTRVEITQVFGYDITCRCVEDTSQHCISRVCH